ncbi:MAG: 2-phospho-L-lactate guanylyltransferase [Solirubrobacterales bacterium]|nr:2-phospho-L-lactate guanylyltransferase [Solirubrobacterales bacterium]
MRTIAILPLKSFDVAKQRLSGTLGNGARQALVNAMFQDVLAALRRVERIDAIAVVTANSTAARAAAVEGVPVLDDPDEAGHNQAAAIGVGHALAEGFDRVLLVAGDTPLIDAGEVDALLDGCAAAGIGFAIVPDRHGAGTNGLLIAPPDAVAPSFGPNSRERHLRLAAEAGVAARVVDVPSLAPDLDTPEDLDVLTELLADPAFRARAPVTRGALLQLDRVRASAEAAGGRQPAA